MNENIPASLLARWADWIGERLGLHFAEDRFTDLARGLQAAIGDRRQWHETAVGRMEETPSPDLSAALIYALTIGETYFYREPKTLEAFEQHILPKLIAARAPTTRTLRLWSAGCCTGEEAYTLAMMVDRALPERRDWQIQILATDLNPRFLSRAREATYGEWSFRGTPRWMLDSYFVPGAKGRRTVAHRIRSMVTFAPLNLIEPTFPQIQNGTANVDVILCRNVLMYFSQPRAEQVVRAFYNCLNEGGWLAVSATETSVKTYCPLVGVNFEDAFLYQKQSETMTRPANCSSFSLGAAPTIAVPAEPAVVEVKRTKLEKKKPVPAPQPEPEAPPVASGQNEARTLYEQGQFAAAVEIWRKASPAGADDIHRFALACANLGQHAEALDVIKHALAQRKLDQRLHYLQAVILEELGDLESSATALQRATYLDPNFILAHYKLGELAARQGREKDGFRHWRNALALLDRVAPDSVVAHSDQMSAGRLRLFISARSERRSVA
jgi:chemotaxis protein methyltransferase CheR